MKGKHRDTAPVELAPGQDTAPVLDVAQIADDLADEQQQQLDDLGGAIDKAQQRQDTKDAQDASDDEQAELQRISSAYGQVSTNTVGRFAVYDDQELRFVAGGGTYESAADAQDELDALRPTTGHALRVVEI